jgi:hypothetical protein
MAGLAVVRLRVAAITVCMLLLAACDAVKLSLDVHLDVPFLAQETLLCVPTSAAMVLAFYGDDEPPRKLKALANGRSYDPAAPFTDFTITPFASLIRGLRTLGYDWRDSALPTTSEGFEQGMAVIRSDLRAGRPVLVDISYSGVGHTFVLTGFDDTKQRIYFVDPAAPAPGRNSAAYSEFEAAWNERAYGGNFRAMIRTQKRGLPAGSAT